MLDLSEFNKTVVLLFLHDEWNKDPCTFGIDCNRLYRTFTTDYSDHLRKKKLTHKVFNQLVATLIEVKTAALVKSGQERVLDQWLLNAAPIPLSKETRENDIFYTISRNVLLASRRENNAELLTNVLDRIETLRPDIFHSNLDELMPNLSKRFLKSIGVLAESQTGPLTASHVRQWIEQCPPSLQMVYKGIVKKHSSFVLSKSSQYYWLLDNPSVEQALQVAKHPDIAHRILDWNVLNKEFPTLHDMFNILDAHSISGKDYSLLWKTTIEPALNYRPISFPTSPFDV